MTPLMIGQWPINLINTHWLAAFSSLESKVTYVKFPLYTNKWIIKKSAQHSTGSLGASVLILLFHQQFSLHSLSQKPFLRLMCPLEGISWDMVGNWAQQPPRLGQINQEADHLINVIWILSITFAPLGCWMPVSDSKGAALTAGIEGVHFLHN